MEFRWNAWNASHVSKHGVSPLEAEWVVNHARPPYPAYAGEGKWRVRGQTQEGRFLQVVFVVDPDETGYVIHARPLTDRERSLLRRRFRQ